MLEEVVRERQAEGLDPTYLSALPWTQAPAAWSHSEGNTGDTEPIYFLPCVWPSLSGD